MSAEKDKSRLSIEETALQLCDRMEAIIRGGAKIEYLGKPGSDARSDALKYFTDERARILEHMRKSGQKIPGQDV